MESLSHYPLLVFAVAFVALWLASAAGSWLRRSYPNAEDEQNEHLGVILAATLTLLALIIGFSFSMSTNRYDQRKNFEEAEANAIGTELLRADFLPPADAANVRKLLGEYLDQRIQFYLNKDDVRRMRLDQRTSQLQADLWSAVRGPSAAQPTPVMALALAGMNDVINSQGYTQAAYWNRIPAAAWYFMAIIALCSSALLGYRSRNGNAAGKLVLVLPLVVSISFLLIADIDAPRHGLIEVRPQNLESLAKSLGR
jgi:dsDNA-binding SOS-regulon protein